MPSIGHLTNREPVTKQCFDVSWIHLIAPTQVCDAMPKAVSCQLRIDAFEPDIDLRCRPPTLFKRKLL